MIYEVRIYTLRPGTLAEFEERYEKRLPLREKHSKLGAFWHTEFGPLNQVIHVYPYDDLQHRTRVRAAMAQDAERNALPGGQDLIVAQEAEIMNPAPFMRPLGSRDYGTGNVYEMRTYTYAPGDLTTIGTTGIPTVKLGSTLTFTNLDTGTDAWHTITTCAYPCIGPTGSDFPVADGTTSTGRSDRRRRPARVASSSWIPVAASTTSATCVPPRASPCTRPRPGRTRSTRAAPSVAGSSPERAVHAPAATRSTPSPAWRPSSRPSVDTGAAEPRAAPSTCSSHRSRASSRLPDA